MVGARVVFVRELADVISDTDVADSPVSVSSVTISVIRVVMSVLVTMSRLVAPTTQLAASYPASGATVMVMGM